MTADFIIRTDHGELKLTTDGRITQTEWDTLTASLRALEPVVVAVDPPMSPEEVEAQVERLVGDGLLAESTPFEWGEPVTAPNAEWTPKPPDIAWEGPTSGMEIQKYAGPLDQSHMGLRLMADEVAEVLNGPRASVHAETAGRHRWTQERKGDSEYFCAYGGCTARARVRPVNAE